MTRVSSGIAGLDRILRGGFIAQRAYAVAGAVGAGKTTFGMHFLAEAGGGLFISFDETEEQIRAEARSLGIDLGNLTYLDLTPDADAFREMRSYDIFSPADVEKEPIAHRISDRMEEERPQRVFIDGFSQFRHLAADGFQFRRLVQSCFRFITDRRATLLVSCDGASLRHDRNIFSAVDGLVMLESTRQSRRLRVVKFRGSDFEPGVHVMQLTGAGIIVASPAA